MMNVDLEAWQVVLFSVLYAVALLAAGWFGGRWLRGALLRLLRARRMDEALARFTGTILQYTILSIAIMAALGKLGVDTTSLLAVFASAGLAIGLALQGSLSNLASGIMILFFRPFNLGDVITSGGLTGRVDDIGLFSTRLVTPDNQTIVLPNAAVTSSSLVNLTRQGTRRATVAVGVAYGSDVDAVQQILLDAVQGLPTVLAEPAPVVLFTNLGASSLDFSVNVWAQAEDWLMAQHHVRVAIYKALNAADIEIPFQQVVIHQAPVPPAAAPPAA